MPINQLIRDGKIDATRGAVLSRAFEYALRELGLVDRVDALTNIVAEKIIEVGATAVTDPAEIARAAIKRLGLPRSPEPGTALPERKRGDLSGGLVKSLGECEEPAAPGDAPGNGGIRVNN
jgi:hypothetical protein